MDWRQAYEQQQRAKLREWQAEIDELQAKADQASSRIDRDHAANRRATREVYGGRIETGGAVQQWK